MYVRGQAAVAASYDPEKFLWEPSRLTAEPTWLGKAADAVDALVGVRGAECVEPAIKWDGIVIKEDNN
jgi:hypothetical protein